MAVDALEAAGMHLAPLTATTKDYLRQRLPSMASIENPVDILAGSGPASYALCLDALLADETVDAVVVITAPQDWFAPLSLAEVIGEVSNSPLGRRKPVLAVIMGLASTSEATQVLHRRRVPNFAFPERIGSTLAAMWQRKQWLDLISSKDPPTAVIPMPIVQEIQTVLADKQGWLEPTEIETVLRASQIPVPVSAMAHSAEEAAQLAKTIGYPLVLKLVATDVTHKTDVGGIRLNLNDPEAVYQVTQDLLNAPVENILGVLMQPMIRDGVEVIVGMVRDPQFGPLMMVGSGGTQVELLHDTAFELAPLTHKLAEEMINATSLGRLLPGYRGKPAADKTSLVDILVKLSHLALNHPTISEIEINPLMVLPAGKGSLAVDTRLRVE